MSGAHTPGRGKKAAPKASRPLGNPGEHSRRLSHTKRGPGRYHGQGKGHQYIPRHVERSAMHPEVIAEQLHEMHMALRASIAKAAGSAS